jgi:CDP-glucose 4,6-dehydratase
MLNQLTEYKDKKILVTGHTGFKGAWLSRTLKLAGADIYGIALKPEPGSLYSRIDDIGFTDSTILDIRDRKSLDAYFKENKFDGVFHLAAQPLVLKSYEEPIETFETNVMGTVNLLSSILNNAAAKWVLAITTDKVYKNIEAKEGYSEEDALFGKDPYSASKAATEMAINAWRSVAEFKNSEVVICVARAGNVIGGGDIAKDRLMPDLIRSFYANIPAVIRNPNSYRPWQHVLDPISGYLKIGKSLIDNKILAHAYNFGPRDDSKLSVEEMVKIACSMWEGNAGYIIDSHSRYPKETKLLWLVSEKANIDLGWKNKLNANESIHWTITWEKHSHKTDPKITTDLQIEKFFGYSA